MNSSITPDPRLLMEAFDGLPLSAAILDGRANIIKVNREWDRFARDNGGTLAACSAGANYLAACDVEEPTARAFADGLREVLAGVEPDFELEYPCHSPGEQRWFVARAAPLRDSAGLRIQGAVVTHLNITARRLAEESLRTHAARLAQVNRDLEGFAHQIAHDLKEPLRSISYQADQLATSAPAWAEEGAAELASIGRLAERGLAMTEGLLAYAKVGLREVDLRRTPLKLVVDAAVESLQALLHDRQVQLSVEPSLPTVMCEPALAVQAVMSVIANSAVHNDSTPRTISIAPATDADGGVGISIHDNGVGIPVADQQRVFGLFERLDPSRSGSGIGLAMVKRIMDLHGGRVRLESHPGRGATVFLTFSAA